MIDESTLDELSRLSAAAFCAPWTYDKWEVECETCKGGTDCPSDDGDCPEPDCDGTHVPNVTIEARGEYPSPPGQVVAQFRVPGLRSLVDKNGALIVALRNNAEGLIEMARDSLRYRALVDEIESDARDVLAGKADAVEFCEKLCIRSAVACAGERGDKDCYCSWRTKRLREELAEATARIGELEAKLKESERLRSLYLLWIPVGVREANRVGEFAEDEAK